MSTISADTKAPRGHDFASTVSSVGSHDRPPGNGGGTVPTSVQRGTRECR